MSEDPATGHSPVQGAQDSARHGHRTEVDPTASAPDAFVLFLFALRQAGFDASTSKAIDAARLLRYMKEHGEARSPELLKARLRPIFCRSSADQRSFDTICDAWLGQAPEDPERINDDSNPPETLGWQKILIQFCKRNERLLWVAAPCVLALALIVPLVMGPARTIDPAAHPARPAFSAIVPERRSAAPVQVRQTSEYFSAVRSNMELSAAFAWSAILLPLAVLLLVGGPAYFLSRTHRRRHAERVHLNADSLQQSAGMIVPELAQDIAQPLERHTRAVRSDRRNLFRRAPLHMRRTIEATMRNFGVPQLHFRHTNLRPSYLMLIDVDNENDPRGQLFRAWANRLRLKKIDVEIRHIRRAEKRGAAPETVRIDEFDGRVTETACGTLDRLDDPPVGQRLIVISSGEIFADADGHLAPWVARSRLYRWRDRAMFTPVEPRDWGEREESIERPERTADPGFIVLPLEESALRAWAKLLVAGELPEIVLTDLQRFPPMLMNGTDLLGETWPPEETVQRLLAQLKLYLGENGFQWLAACAVAPVMRADLILLIGDAFFRAAGVRKKEEMERLISRNYRRLARLPWLHDEKMPEWLRMRLLDQLPPTSEERVRDAVRQIFADLKPSADGALLIDIEPMPGKTRRVASSTTNDQGDAIYLGYMSGMTVRRLMMRMPGKTWRAWLRALPGADQPRRSLRVLAGSVADWCALLWSRAVFRDGLVYRGVRGTVWIVGGCVIVSVALLASTCLGWVDRSPFFRQLLMSPAAHLISYGLRGTRVTGIAFSPDGGRLLTVSDDTLGRLWTVENGLTSGEVLKHSGRITASVMCADGEQAVTASEDLVVQVWDTTEGRVGSLLEPIQNFDGDVTSLACDADGSRLAIAHRNGVVGIYRMDSGKRISRMHVDGPAYAVAFAGDGRLLIATDEGVVTDLGPRGGPPKVVFKWFGTVRSAAFSGDGNRVIAVGPDVVRLWDVETAQEVETLMPRGGDVTLAAISANGAQVLTVNERGAQLWGADSARPLRTFPDMGGPVTAAAFSPDGNHLVLGYIDRALLWSGERSNFTPSAFDLDALHAALMAWLYTHLIEASVVSGLGMVLVTWLNAYLLRRRIEKVISV
jgi:WD40 repeat protein